MIQKDLDGLSKNDMAEEMDKYTHLQAQQLEKYQIDNAHRLSHGLSAVSFDEWKEKNTPPLPGTVYRNYYEIIPRPWNFAKFKTNEEVQDAALKRECQLIHAFLDENCSAEEREAFPWVKDDFTDRFTEWKKSMKILHVEGAEVVPDELIDALTKPGGIYPVASPDKFNWQTAKSAFSDIFKYVIKPVYKFLYPKKAK